MNASKYALLLFCLTTIACNTKEKPLFKLLAPEQTGITFTNTITETDSFNILVKEFVYNGGGVATGDLNGDGLADLFFTGNQVENTLYLNKGNLEFEEVTATAQLQKKYPQQWSSGINILDLNLDGKLDIYVCNTLDSDAEYRKNLLYINQGNDEKGVPIFREMAAAYGIDDASHSSHAQFFDYDQDGDLDLFVGVNWIEREYPNRFVELTDDGSAPNRDNLFRNEWSDSLGHPIFTDVSLAAGIVYDGYSHSTLIHDFNADGWQDIYVANDYQSNDLIFINNQDGTFSNRANQIFKHFSMSSMGSDLGDINNDGKADFFTSEMQPYYNQQKKRFQGPSSYQGQQLTEKFQYDYQYTRNTLQLNTGINPETGLPLYSEMGMYAGIQETDWSWSSLFADYDNDGWKDLFVANGFPKNIIDRDFADFRASVSNVASKAYLLSLIPAIRVPNFIFQNQGDLTFQNKSKDWGLDYPSFSNGAIYVDLDEDGDLDLVTNNIDDPAFIFENTSNPMSNEDSPANFLRIQLKGAAKNPDAFGAKVQIVAGDEHQTNYLLAGRGYLSKVENTLHFGLGATKKVDRIIVDWADGRQSLSTDVAANQVIQIDHAQSKPKTASPSVPATALFAEVSQSIGLSYQHEEMDFADFNYQRTLPHKFSQYNPALSVADINQDGLEDVFIGGNAAKTAQIFFQQPDQSYENKAFVSYESAAEDAGSLLFDADQDGDVDLYIARGSGQFLAGDSLYQDLLWLNDGTGNFALAKAALPKRLSNASCVKAADFDQDGDLDLFVGGSVKPFSYPFADDSYLLRNDSQAGVVKFTDISDEAFTDRTNIGIVSDAIWTDFNNDFLPDLIIASKWRPLQFYENKNGQLIKSTSQAISNKSGWWNSIAAADLDNDGDTDYIVGNFGENLYYRCQEDEPIRVYGKDLDNNGMVDPLISCYWQDSLGNKDEYLYHPRADLINQVVSIRKKYNTYAEYGAVNVSQMFSAEEMEGALILAANYMKSVVIENLGDGQFTFHELPVEAQFAPLYGIKAMDVNGDHQLDLLLIGNDLGVEVQQGRADATNGLVLINKGGFNFSTLPAEKSHFYVPNAGIALVSMASENGALLLASQNRAALKSFQLQASDDQELVLLQADEVKAIHYFEDGKRTEEFYWGSGFLSQSGRYVQERAGTTKIEFFDETGKQTRSLDVNL
ncbi:MAG: VCBS repeat-containing protein [Bacteroidota bacterium]